LDYQRFLPDANLLLQTFALTTIFLMVIFIKLKLKEKLVVHQVDELHHVYSAGMYMLMHLIIKIIMNQQTHVTTQL